MHNSNLTWKWIGEVSGTNRLTIPDEAREVKIKVLIQPTSSSTVLTFDFEYINEYSYADFENHIKGFYYSSGYYASVGIYAQKGQIFLLDSSQWTKICYSSTIIDIPNLHHCRIRVWYK